MKIQAIKSVNTVSPEKHWFEGEICDLPEKVGKQLLNNPNFRIVETFVKPKRIHRFKRKRK